MTNVISRGDADLLPIRHVSYSCIRQWSADQQLFFKWYIRHDFNDEKGLAQLIWVSCHAWVEEAINTGMYIPEAMFSIAQQKFFDEVVGAIHNGYNKWREGTKIPDFVIPTLTEEEMMIGKKVSIYTVLDEIEKLLNDKKELAENYGLTKKEIDEIDVEKGLESRFRYVEWLKKENVVEDAESRIDKGICNFIDNKDDLSIIAAEMDIFTFFKDEEGNDMPLPLKAKIDVAALDEDWESIVGIDHKFKEKLSSEEDTIFPAYEMQAGFYKIALEAELGRPVKRFIFNEVKTWEATAPKLLQAELNALMDANWLEYDRYMTNAIKTDMLVKMWILKMGKTCKKIVIDFEQKKYIHPMCLEIYKRFLNQLNLLYVNDSKFLPNLSDFFWGTESYLDFLQEITWIS